MRGGAGRRGPGLHHLAAGGGGPDLELADPSLQPDDTFQSALSLNFIWDIDILYIYQINVEICVNIKRVEVEEEGRWVKFQ